VLGWAQGRAQVVARVLAVGYSFVEAVCHTLVDLLHGSSVKLMLARQVQAAVGHAEACEENGSDCDTAGLNLQYAVDR
jgi:hypothetical protein